MNKVLVISAHLDDEVLGCGGTMARHAGDGDELSVLNVCDRSEAHRLMLMWLRDCVSRQIGCVRSSASVISFMGS